MQQMQRPNPVRVMPEELPDTPQNIWDELLRQLKIINYNTSVPLSAVDSYVFVDEWDNISGTSLILQFNQNFPVLATSIVASIPTGSGQLQIGRRLIPMTGGNNV